MFQASGQVWPSGEEKYEKQVQQQRLKQPSRMTTRKQESAKKIYEELGGERQETDRNHHRQ